MNNLHLCIYVQINERLWEGCSPTLAGIRLQEKPLSSVTYFSNKCTLILSRFIHLVTLIPVWISNYIRYKVWCEITYPFLNSNGCTVEVWEWISNLITLYWACDYLFMLGFKLIHISKRAPDVLKIDGSMQKRHNCSMLVMKLCLFSNNHQNHHVHGTLVRFLRAMAFSTDFKYHTEPLLCSMDYNSLS